MQGNFVHFMLLIFRLQELKTDRKVRFERIGKVIVRLRLAFILVISSLGVGTIGYVMIDGYPWFDAWYMSVITLASVGFGEVHPLSQAGRVFTSFLILFNIGLFTYSISTITSIFAEGGFTNILREFRMNKQIDALVGHTIVCGFGRHATEVAQELDKQGIPFVIIENNPEKLERLRRNVAFLYIEGDATDDHTLIEAGVERAHSLVITLPSDADNLFIVMTARQINHRLHIISRYTNPADEAKLRRAGANHTVLPEQIGGFYMATLVNKPDLVEFFNLISNMGPSNIVFEEIPVSSLRPEFRHKTISSSGLDKISRVPIVAVRYPGGEYELNPQPSAVLHSDWHIVVLGNQEQMAQFKSAALTEF